MTPLMLSLIFWRAAHTSNVPYPHFSMAATRGSLTKLHATGLVEISDIMACEYTLTNEGRAFVLVVQGGAETWT